MNRLIATIAFTLLTTVGAAGDTCEVLVLRDTSGLSVPSTCTWSDADILMTRVLSHGGHIISSPRITLDISLPDDTVAAGRDADTITMIRSVGSDDLDPPLKRIKTADLYSRGAPSPDGIGKIYMGREISQVMGHLGAGWLERSTREQEERTDLLVELMDVEPDEVIADIGAGTGYFSLRLARRVPLGGVVAVDIQPEMIQLLQDTAGEKGIDNGESVLGAVDDTRIPANTIDVVLLVDAYHEFSHPWEMKESLMTALKPGGRIVLVEYRAEDPTVMIKPHHKMTQEQARREFEAAGFRWITTHDDLPQQHVLIFQKPLSP